MNLPAGIRDAIQERIGAVRSVRGAAGGMVNHAARVETDGAPVFVKWKQDAPPGLFGCEARGLDLLRGASPLRVPAVIHVHDSASNNTPPFLLLECVDLSSPTDGGEFARSLAEGIAALHSGNPAPDGLFGLDHDNYLGSLYQENGKLATWPEFYRDRRLLPLMQIGERQGWLNSRRRQRLSRIMERVPGLLGHPDTRPCLIHGDLWSGNFMASGNQPWLIDPAVYYGDREVEMAFIELFGGFPSRFSELYDAAYPLDRGYHDRRPLLQLYPLLVHLNHFGEEYGPAVDSVLERYS